MHYLITFWDVLSRVELRRPFELTGAQVAEANRYKAERATLSIGENKAVMVREIDQVAIIPEVWQNGQWDVPVEENFSFLKEGGTKPRARWSWPPEDNFEGTEKIKDAKGRSWNIPESEGFNDFYKRYMEGDFR